MAAPVLHYFGEGGVQSGSFITKLVEACASADPENLLRLGSAFPEVVEAFVAARDNKYGVPALQAAYLLQTNGLSVTVRDLVRWLLHDIAEGKTAEQLLERERVVQLKVTQ